MPGEQRKPAGGWPIAIVYLALLVHSALIAYLWIDRFAAHPPPSRPAGDGLLRSKRQLTVRARHERLAPPPDERVGLEQLQLDERLKRRLTAGSGQRARRARDDGRLAEFFARPQNTQVQSPGHVWLSANSKVPVSLHSGATVTWSKVTCFADEC